MEVLFFFFLHLLLLLLRTPYISFFPLSLSLLVIGIAVLKLIVTQHSKALFSLLEEILKSALIAQHFTLVFETVSRSSKMPQNLRARALQTLGQNRNINSRVQTKKKKKSKIKKTTLTLFSFLS